jgi:hypothetical protein
MQKLNVYQTQCIETAASIMTAGASLIEVQKLPTGRSIFIFEQTKRLKEIQKLHTQQKLVLPSQVLLTNLKFLKTKVKESNQIHS